MAGNFGICGERTIYSALLPTQKKVCMVLKQENPRLPTVEFRLLGGFDVLVNGQPLPPLRSRREQWLLTLLVLRHDRDTSRDWLATTLWPDVEERQALFYLRKS